MYWQKKFLKVFNSLNYDSVPETVIDMKPLEKLLYELAQVVVTTNHKLCGLNNRNLCLTVLEPGSPNQGVSGIGSF